MPIIGIPVNPSQDLDIARMIGDYNKDVTSGKTHRRVFFVKEMIAFGDFKIRNQTGTELLDLNPQTGAIDVRGGGTFGGNVESDGAVINYVGKELPFLLTSDPDMSDLLHIRVQIVNALAKLVSTTDPTLNTDLIWSGFSSTGQTPFYYKSSGVLTAWPSGGVGKADWGGQGICVVPSSASALVSGTTYYARGWLWDGAAYSDSDDLIFVA